MQKYSVNQQLIETILSWVRSGEISIPEIQRPFVWSSTKVRDLIDSIYKGYPVGYIIAWRNPNVRLKDGTVSSGKKILIDGQQRVTALTAALLGNEIIDEDYEKTKIKIAFNPIEERFEVLNPAIKKDSSWIHDISPLVSGEERISKLIKSFCEINPSANSEKIEDSLEKLKQITKKQIGLIELDSDLDIEVVTEIFIRINSKGVVLSQADFAMSKIASNEAMDGYLIRKCIDYFCHLCRKPEFLKHIEEVDKEFIESEFYNKIKWISKANDDLYIPDYSDVMRVAFISEFERGKLSDLVSLLSGRNFETRKFEARIVEESFQKLKAGIINFSNETNYERFLMIIKSAGFIDQCLLSSQNVLNFGYVVYLSLRKQNFNAGKIESHVRRWMVFSWLTSRYSGSPESTFDFDIKRIYELGITEYLSNLEAAELSEGFWSVGLIQQLDTSNINSPSFNVFLASQCKDQNLGFLSKDISVRELLMHEGQIHHIFPKDYLKKNGFDKNKYNHIANYVYMQSEINIKVGNKAPIQYMKEILTQCKTKELKYGSIENESELEKNLLENCIPELIYNSDHSKYNEFIKERISLMAKKIKDFYYKL